MALATRCPHCQTTFRVANDQLKLHAGLVRCGACQQTFNGVEHLVALAAPAAGPSQASAAPVGTAAPAAALPEAPPSASALEFDLGRQDEAVAEPAAAAANADEMADDIALAQAELETRAALPSAADWSLSDSAESPAAMPAATAPPAASGPAGPEPEAGDALLEPYIDETEAALASHAASGDDSISDAELDAATADAEDDDFAPAFVLRAKQAQSRSRRVRLLMLALALILLPALLAQTVYALRNQIAAWRPDAKPALAQACQFLHCQLALPAQIEQISIESNELQALSAERNVFALALQLQNRSSTLQAWPTVELVLNDARDKAVLQRAFSPADYLENPAALAQGFAPGSEQNIKLYFELPKLKAAGYHVSVFYP